MTVTELAIKAWSIDDRKKDFPFPDHTVRVITNLIEKHDQPFRLVFTGPFGYGQSALLAELQYRYHAKGLRILDISALSASAFESGGFGGEPESLSDSILLLENAHQISASQLEFLPNLLRHGLCRIIAFAQPGSLNALDELLNPSHFSLPTIGFEQLLRLTRGNEKLARSLQVYTAGIPEYVYQVLKDRGLASVTDTQALTSPANRLTTLLHRLDSLTREFVVSASVGAGRNTELLEEVLGCPRSQILQIVENAREHSLIGPNGDLIPIVANAAASTISVEQRSETLQKLANSQIKARQPVLTTALALLETKATGTTVATALATAGRETIGTNPTLAKKLLAAAVNIGQQSASLLVDWALAAALSGDLETAVKATEDIIDNHHTDHQKLSAMITAAVSAHRGELARSAEFYRWSDDPAAHSFAKIALLGTGQVVRAEERTEASTRSMPTILASASAQMAKGVAESISGSAGEALSTMMNGATLLDPVGANLLLPDSPAALGAIISLHCGELTLANCLLEKAINNNIGGPLFTSRHRVLLGWTAMAQGDLEAAKTHLRMLPDRTLEPRDELFRSALDVGLARRDSDLLRLRKIWDSAYQAVMQHPIDLYMLLPLGELAVAAARLGEFSKLSSRLEQAEVLLENLGNPPTWRVMTLWYELHAALVLEDKNLAEQRLIALGGYASVSPQCSALFEAAGSWLSMLAGKIDPAQVTRAAENLNTLGMHWDAARLAGQAAIRTSDREAMITLLETARQFLGKSRVQRASRVSSDAEEAPPRATTVHVDISSLSEREREVASLVVTGLTYHQVGQKLFISGKTVEHHMARIRTKLGIRNRRELLATLREILGSPEE